MSGHYESFLPFPERKDPLARSPVGIQDDEYPSTTDSREEERELSSCEEAFSMSREENRVHLYPRFDPSFDGNEQDQSSIQAACTTSSFGSMKERSFLRGNSPPPSIPDLDDISCKRDKPSLCRSLAWSQDSLDERRIVKRRRRDEASPTSLNECFSFSGFQHNRQPSAESLTAIHWEEKIVDSMELISFLDQASTVSNQAEMQSA